MPDHGPESPDRSVSTDRLRMDLYELLHERAETERQWQFWRLAAGHAVVGAILGYAILFENWRFVSLTPVLYGIVVLDGLKTSIRMLYLQRQLVELEGKLSAREPLFDWVSQYGLFGPGRRLELWEVDVNSVPETAQYALILSVYLGLIVVSLITWTPLSEESGAVGIPVTRSLLLVSYATFTLLLAVIVFVGYLHFKRVRDQITDRIGS